MEFTFINSQLNKLPLLPKFSIHFPLFLSISLDFLLLLLLLLLPSFPSTSSPSTMTFKEAYLRLQEIHQMLQTSDVIDIEEIVQLQKEAKECYDLCQEMLMKQTQ
ncbi:exodeoxyribonuclease VII small subunit [Patescibacteria group bacterium]|nr:exodeoxyribonuclease VII small subunit [Patescibacteria group bacterium]